MKLDPLITADFYKVSHRQQYPDGTNLVYSNFTPRSAKLANISSDQFDGKVTFFGLQYFIKAFLIEAWDREFFGKPKAEVVARYKRRMDTALGPDSVPVDHIEALHDLGYLPIRIKALPEGVSVPVKVPVLVIHNTHPEFFWLTNYLETALSAYLWKPMTSATVARHYRKLLDAYAATTGADPGFVQFQAHDFSFRGMSGPYDAALSGAGHLLSFVGTDTIAAIDLIEDYYRGDAEKELIGCSVPASEHSVMSMGTFEAEIETFRRFITQLYPAGIVSIVSDTWDFWRVVTEYAAELKPDILAREGKLVFRPDSGDPVRILCGEVIPSVDQAEDLEDAKAWAKEIIDNSVCDATPHGVCGPRTQDGLFEFRGSFYRAVVEFEWNRYDKRFYYIDEVRLVSFDKVKLTPEQKGAVQCLWEIFGGTTTENGFKLLDSHVGLIYGDSITLERAHQILEALKAKGFASSNVVFGIGSYTYQHVTRDTFGMAVKSTYGEVNGVGREIFKDPKTDSGAKKSARGLLKVIVDEDGDYELRDQQKTLDPEGCCLREVFKDGKLLIDESIGEIRARVLGKEAA